MCTRRRITEERIKRLRVSGQVDATTVLSVKPETVEVKDATCLDEKTALKIAMATSRWPVVRGWAFCGDLFEFMINRAIEESAGLAGRDIDGVVDPELFEETLLVCADLLRRR